MTEFELTPDPRQLAVSDSDALAMEFALGSLDRDARKAAQLRMTRDPDFRAEVEAWQVLLAPLALSVVSMAPPQAVWERIAADLPPAYSADRALSPKRASMWSSISLWRGWAVASTAMASLAVLMLLNRLEPAAAPQLLVATLASPTGSALLTATYDRARGAVILTPADKSATSGRTPELWVIEGDNPPRSLGTIDIDKPGSHAIPAERLQGLKEGSTLAISLEPKGGSKTGTPTGPVVATGKLTGI